ncbi:hypothetical protein SH528x_003445 [Novipirellula sp. SH528]|uniref:hypothetical protein n=1 Tax=Novipirellula sp. SH528 TaxID=3454466 RepID=UPI003FA0BB5A
MTSRATAVFGTWRTAMGAAGFKSPREKWSRDRILRELKQRRGNCQTKDRKLESAAARYFGSIREALKAAGLPAKTSPPAHCDWTRQNAIEAICKRVADGNDLRATCREDPALYVAARRLFGSWTCAREEAGFPIPIKKRLSADEVKRQIRKRHRDGLTLSNMRVRDLDLHRSAKWCFGSWGAAVEAAGLELTMRRRWTKQRIVQAMHTRHAGGAALCRTWREDKSLFRAAILWFGSWEQAMRAADFEPIRRERWTKQRVIERLRAWRERTRDTNLSIAEPNLSAAATRLFGSLDAAFQAADIPPSPRRWTNERVIAEIQERYVRGEPKHTQGLGDIRLAYAAKRRFGSWASAVDAAGLADRIPIAKPLRRWSKQQVVDAIQRGIRDGVQLSNISKTEQGLYNAAKTHFGTWRKAVKAAGVSPTRRQWSKQTILAEIHERHRRGQTLASGHPTTVGLVAAAGRYFGSWSAALLAAGIQNDSTNRRAAS